MKPKGLIYLSKELRYELTNQQVDMSYNYITKIFEGMYLPLIGLPPLILYSTLPCSSHAKVQICQYIYNSF